MTRTEAPLQPKTRVNSLSCLILPPLALGLALLGCDDAQPAEPPFHPIGLTDAEATDTTRPDTGPSADAGPPPALPLRLRFEPVPNDAGALRITDLAFTPTGDGRFLVVDKDGEAILMQLEGTRARRLGSFAVPGVWADSDAGLISVAFDPGFADNGFFYLGLTTSIETNVIRRYTLHPDDFARSVETEVEIIAVTGPRSPRSWHNVGSIGFTDEGYLWALFGDKELEEYAQDPTSPLGSLVRIIPDRLPFPESQGGYTTPPDNPFADGSGHPAVYVKGLRSPWKGLYRGGHWFTSDVGLDRYEEINRIEGPGSLGWPLIEGPCRDPLPEGAREADAPPCGDHTPPWIAWGRSGSHPFVRDDLEATAARMRSAWVGWQYMPNDRDPYGGRWNDVLTFGDAFVGFIRARRTDGRGESWPAAHLQFTTAWAQGPDGYVYVTALGTWPIDAPVTPSPILRAVLAD